MIILISPRHCSSVDRLRLPIGILGSTSVDMPRIERSLAIMLADVEGPAGQSRDVEMR